MADAQLEIMPAVFDDRLFFFFRLVFYNRLGLGFDDGGFFRFPV